MVWGCVCDELGMLCVCVGAVFVMVCVVYECGMVL